MASNYNMVAGDSYPISVKITQGITTITPDIASGVKIKIGDIEDEYPNGAVSFASGTWQMFITQEQSRRLSKDKDGVLFQVQVKIGNDIVGSVPSTVKVAESIITDDWSE